VAADARVANMATRTKLADELNFFVSFMQVLFILTLNLCISQRFKSSSALSWLKRWIFAGPMRSWPADWWK
jgi:hypothetical protein